MYRHKGSHVAAPNKVHNHNITQQNADAVKSKKLTDAGPPRFSYPSSEAYTVGQQALIQPAAFPTVAAEAYSTGTTTIGSGFSAPYGVAVDAAGNVYVADEGNSAIKKIPAGGGTPVAIGSGFKLPTGVAVDAAGNIYVADRGNNAVKKIPAGGGTTVTLGSGFSRPTGIAVDASGNVYVADQGNNAVKELIGGVGTPVTLGSGFNGPTGVSVDSGGDVYVADAGNNLVKRINFGSSTPVTIGGGYKLVIGLAVNTSGDLYVADYENNSAEEILLGGEGGSLNIGGGFSLPTGIALDNAGNVYVADFNNNAIKKISPVGGYYCNILPAGLFIIQNTGVIEGTVTTATTATNYTVTGYDSSGSAAATINITVNPLIFSYSSPQTYPPGTAISPLAPTVSSGTVGTYNYENQPAILGSGFNLPGGIAVDGAGNVYVADAGNNVVKKIPAGGGAPVVIGSGFNQPAGLAVDGSGNVYVADKGNNAVKKIPAGGGSPVTLGSGFYQPTGVAVDGTGNVYVADGGNNAVKEINFLMGDISTLGSGFSDPAGVAVDNWGNVYVADKGNNAVKELIGGAAPAVTLGSGFSGPTAVAVDFSGNVFVVDYGNAVTKEIVNGGTSLLDHTGFFAGGVAVDGAGRLYLTDSGLNDVAQYAPSGGYFINNLPVGLSFNGNTGVISGTPISWFSGNCTVTAYNGTKGASTTLNITVNAPPMPFSYPGPQDYIAGTAITPLPPTGSGVAAPAYNTSATTLSTAFNTPAGIALDSYGYVYVADQNDGAIKKITIAGIAPDTVALGFVSPDGVAVDAAFNVYVADNGGNAIKKVPAGGGAIVTLGSGFFEPHGVAVDAAGNVYVADYGNSAVKEIPASGGSVITLGSGFNHPTDVVLDSYGNIYVADYGNSAIKKIPAGGGAVVTLATGFTAPTSVAVDGTGNVFLTDYGNHAVKEVPAGGGSVLTIASGFTSLYGIAVNAINDVYITDYSINAVEKITPKGGYYIERNLPLGMGFNNTTGVMSGTPLTSSPASVYSVIGYNSQGSTVGSVSIKVVSNNANLANLAINSGTLTPAFTPTVAVYTASVPDIVTSIQITPTTSDPLATVTVNGTAVPYATAISLPLTAGANKFSIKVTATNGTTFAIYTLTVNQLPTLSALTLSAGTLAPVFAGTTTSYTASVSNTTTAITLTPTVNASGSTVNINGTAVPSGAASQAIPLNVGANIVTIVVTGSDGTSTQTYTVTVTRAASSIATLSALKPSKGVISPAFSSGTTSYTENVVNGVTSLTITPTVTDPTATVKVDGAVVASGSPSQTLALVVGANTFPIKVIAQDGVTTETYTLVVTRGPSANCYLSNLKPSAGSLTPTFSASKTAYTTAVVNGAATITITPITAVPTSTVTVNGTAVTSGTASNPIALNVGSNTITTIVTAQDGTTTRTYTLTVTRAPSSNANLSAFKISKGTLTPAFATGTTSYTASVVNGVTSMTVTPTAADATASIEVDGTVVPSGTASGAIALAVGSNTITTVVTAQDGVTTNTYTLTVTRASGGADSYDPGISVTKPIETPTLADDGIVVHQAVSPNGDGINDFLLIDNIGQYPDNKLAIMNRNGQLIFETRGYDNSSKVFDGHSNKNGQMQLPGTYFYQLDYTVKGITKTKTGFIVLKY